MARTWQSPLLEPGFGVDIIDTSPARPAFKFATAARRTEPAVSEASTPGQRPEIFAVLRSLRDANKTAEAVSTALSFIKDYALSAELVETLSRPISTEALHHVLSGDLLEKTASLTASLEWGKGASGALSLAGACKVRGWGAVLGVQYRGCSAFSVRPECALSSTPSLGMFPQGGTCHFVDRHVWTCV